jgi:hypothetical protein
MDDPTQHGAADDDFRTRTSGTGLSDCSRLWSLSQKMSRLALSQVMTSSQSTGGYDRRLA